MFSKATLLFTTLVLSSLAQVSYAKLTFDAPNELVMCGQASMKISGGKAPYTVTVYKACDGSDSDEKDDVLETHKVDKDATVNWMVNYAEYQNIQLGVSDADGQELFSDDFQVKTSTTGNCVGKPAVFNVANPDSTPSSAGTPPPPVTQTPPAASPNPNANTPNGVNPPPINAPPPVVAGAGANSATSNVASFALITLVSAVAVAAGMC